ncbi:MAG: PfkB family carbohydrate kinase [Actinomycetales bacterium]
MTGRVLVVGSANIDVVLRVGHLPGPGETVLADSAVSGYGGKGANQAVAAARAGAPVSMVGRVGGDDAGPAYRERLAAFGVDVTRLVPTPASRTGTAYVLVGADGENSIVVDPGANALVSGPDLAPVESLSVGDVLLVQCELAADVVARAVRLGHERGALVVVNLAPFVDLPGDVLAAAHAVVVNEAEASRLGFRAAVSLVVTHGADGASWDGTVQPAVPVPAADVVDTTGAGDAFCGALAAALAAGRDRAGALAAAVAAGADAVQRMGAQPEP